MDEIKWLEVAVNTTPDRLDQVCAKLAAAGMDSVVIEDEQEFLSFLEQNRQYWDYVDQELLDRMKGVTRVKFYVTDDADGRAQLKQYTRGLETEYTTKLGDALDSLTDTSFTAGVNTGRELIGGLASMEEALYSQAQEMANRVSEILAGAGRIPSNSELAASFSTDRIREQFNGVTPQQLQNVGVGMVNAMNTMNGAPQPLSITIQTEDKLTIARAFVPDIRTASRENPETLDDK